MQIEWIAAGVVLLVGALAAKMMLEQLLLQRIGLAFTFGWAFLMALHFWEAGMGVFGGVAGLLPGMPPEVVVFWVLFLLAAAPGIILIRAWLKTYDAVFPFLFERASAVFCTLLFALGLPSLVIMTAMLMPPRISRVLPSKGMAGTVTRGLEQAPLKIYLGVATPLSPWTRDELAAQRIPERVRRAVNNRSGAASRPPG